MAEPILQPTLITIPSIETPRTILRAHRAGDFERYREMWANPLVTRFIGGKTRSREESWQKFLRHAGLWTMLGYGYWAVEEIASGRFIGEAGFQDALRDMSPSIEGIPEAGWVLHPDAHGRGLASEIASAIVAWSDRNLAASQTVCIIDPAHEASLRVARKSGYIDDETVPYGVSEIVILRRPRVAARG